MLVGIRPDPMQALAWGLGGASHRHRRRADRAVLLHLAHRGRGADAHRLRRGVPGRLRQRAGRADCRAADRGGARRSRPIGSVPVYQDAVVYALFLVVLWVRPQGLLGTV